MSNESERAILDEWQSNVFGPGGLGTGHDRLEWEVRCYANAMTTSWSPPLNPGFDASAKRAMLVLIEKLKIARYVKGEGTWLAATVVFDADRGPSVTYDLVDQRSTPSQTVLGAFPSASDLRAELMTYPRYRHNIPHWAVEQCAAQGEQLCYLDPDGQQVECGNDRMPFRSPGTPRPKPALPPVLTLAELGVDGVRPGRTDGPVVTALRRYARACAEVTGADSIILRPPPSAADLAAWQSSLGVELPVELAELYSYANGEPEDYRSFCLGGHFWMESVARMTGVAAGIEQRFRDMSFRNATPPGEQDVRLQPVWYDRRWIPFGTLDGNLMIAIDTAPTEHGTFGQIVAAGHHLRAPEVLAPTLAAYIDQQSDLVLAGQYSLEDATGSICFPWQDRTFGLAHAVTPDRRQPVLSDVFASVDGAGGLPGAVGLLGYSTSQDGHEQVIQIPPEHGVSMSVVRSGGAYVIYAPTNSPNRRVYARLSHAQDAATFLLWVTCNVYRSAAGYPSTMASAYPEALPGGFFLQPGTGHTRLSWSTSQGPASAWSRWAEVPGEPQVAIRFAQFVGHDLQTITESALAADGFAGRMPDGVPLYRRWPDLVGERRRVGIPRDEQIRAVLAWDTFTWAHRYLLEGETIDDVRFHDLISVTADDIYRFVEANGLGPALTQAEGLMMFTAPNGALAVGVYERGQWLDVVEVPTLEAGRREIIRRCIEGARIALNHRYRGAHPELDLPASSQMD